MTKALVVARKELRQILRDRQTLAILLFVPMFVLLLFGYALNFDVRHIRLAVEDRDRSVQSRALVSAFTNSGYFDRIATISSGADVTRLMNTGQARAVLVIPEQFGERLQTGAVAPIQVLVNGDNANTATTVLGYVLAIVRAASAEYQPPPRIVAEPRVWFNPELRSTLFLVPGLIAYIATITAVISTALSLVREKERGTIEQVRMAPIGTLSFVLGKSVPYFVVSLVAALLVLLAAMLLFEMPMRGSWALLLLATALFLVSALGFGLLISTIAESQQVAFQMALIVSFLPTFVLSGFVFPIASMPAAVRAITYVVPARYYLRALRGIVLKGAGLEAFGVDLAALAAFGMVVVGLAAIRLARSAEA